MKIALLAYDGISPFMLSTPIAVFGEYALPDGYRIDVCADTNSISASGGLTIAVSHTLASASSADLIIFPGWRDADEPVPQTIIDVLIEAANRGAVVAGLCLGAFGLAQAGLLNGRRATTHWALAEVFAKRFPDVDVDAGAIFIDEGAIVTSAGVASALDCCLHLVARFSDQAEANRIARHLVVAPQRSGTHAQLLERPAPSSTSEHRVAHMLESIWANPLLTPSLDALAQSAGMSARSMTRHIRTQTGDNLTGWLRCARLARAQGLLAAGNPIELTATQSGFPDSQALRTAFAREYRMSPSQWVATQRRD